MQLTTNANLPCTNLVHKSNDALYKLISKIKMRKVKNWAETLALHTVLLIQKMGQEGSQKIIENVNRSCPCGLKTKTHYTSQ